MAVAKDFITNALRTSLLRFVKDASGEQLHLRNLLSGTVELGPDVPLAEPAIQQVLLDIGFPASVQILSAHADTIRVHIPWAKLLGQSTRLVINQLTVQVRVHEVAHLAAALETTGEGFLQQQKERLESMVEKRCRKPPEGMVKKLSLLETVIQGLRVQVNTVRLEILRECDETPYLAAELSGFNISPCTGAKRPTLELSEARAVIDMAGILPPPLKPYAFRRLFRFDSALAHVCLQEERLMPWVKAENWCRVARFGPCCLRTNIYQASLRPRGGALIMEDGAGLLGVDRQLDLEDSEVPALDIDMDAPMAVELATLGGHFFTGFDVTGGWRHRKVLERLPEMAGLGTNGTNSISHEVEEVAGTNDGLPEKLDQLLRDSLRAERGRARRNSVLSGLLEKSKREPGERVLISGWLTKRAKLRPFQDSWQERWCELSQMVQGHGVLRYSAPGRPGEMQLKGEILLAPASGAHVIAFEDAQNVGSELSLKRVVEEFKHGFALHTAKDSPHEGRIFFFATERSPESERWVSAIRTVLDRPQRLEEFLSLDEFLDTSEGPEEKDTSVDTSISEVTEDVSDDGSFVSVEESPLEGLEVKEPAGVEELLSKVKQFQTTKLSIQTLQVRIGLVDVRNPLPDLWRADVPASQVLHARIGGLELHLLTRKQGAGAAVAPLAKLMAVPQLLVDGLLGRKASWSACSTGDLKLCELQLLGQKHLVSSRPNLASPIDLHVEQSFELAPLRPNRLTSTKLSGTVARLCVTVDLPVLLALQLFFAKLGPAFAPSVQQGEQLEGPPRPPIGLKLRLDDLEVEVPLAGLPVSGQGLRVSIAGLQLNSMEALESFVSSLRNLGRS